MLRFERAMRLHDRMFHESLCEGRAIADVATFASAAEEREAFRRWLVARAKAQRADGDGDVALAERDTEAVEQIMAAYDRAHGTLPAAGAGNARRPCPARTELERTVTLYVIRSTRTATTG